MFVGGDVSKPVVIGVVRERAEGPRDTAGHVEFDVDGRRLIVSGKQQIVLRCGKASITLTREGKILMSGTHIVTRASGVNRIKGGSVQIN